MNCAKIDLKASIDIGFAIVESKTLAEQLHIGTDQTVGMFRDWDDSVLKSPPSAVMNGLCQWIGKKTNSLSCFSFLIHFNFFMFRNKCGTTNGRV